MAYTLSTESAKQAQFTVVNFTISVTVKMTFDDYMWA